MGAVATDHFDLSEWVRDPSRVDTRLCHALEAVRKSGGVPVTIHVAYDTSGHAPSSYHYRGQAVDFHFSPRLPLADQLAAILSVTGLGGIGYYPEWAHPGWHVDLRDDRLFWVQRAGRYHYYTRLDDFKTALGVAASQSQAFRSRGDLLTLDPANLLARVIWGECRGADAMEARAIAHVVVNRASRPGWWGKDVKSVCMATKQFSCLNPNDPNLTKILKGDFSDGDWSTCQREAADAISGTSKDPTGGAVAYHATYIGKPADFDGAKRLCTIGKHIFYGVEG